MATIRVETLAESPLERLTSAVLRLDEDMERLHEQGKAKAGELVRTADALAGELENDIRLLLREITEELERTVREKSEELRRRYAAEKEEKLRAVRFSAEINMDAAVQRILEELRKILSEV